MAFTDIGKFLIVIVVCIHGFLLDEPTRFRRKQFSSVVDKILLPLKESASSDDNDSKDVDSQRRAVITRSMAGLTAEAAWRQAVWAYSQTDNAPALKTNVLPEGSFEILEAGKAVVIPNWLGPAECRALRQDIADCYQAGHFKNFVLSRNPSKADREANDRWIMTSFSKRTGQEGPFVDATIGNIEIRQTLKARMAQIKASLTTRLYDRPTLASNVPQTHEMEYLRYGQGAYLQRHTDEHHIELQYAGGSARSKKPNATRRSITWMVYVNEPDWDVGRDGGQLRLHERAMPSVSPVGARGRHLQIGWLRAVENDADRPEQPVFLDPNHPGPENESCMLFTFDRSGHRIDLSRAPFPNAYLYLSYGDLLARKTMVDPIFSSRFHLIDGPKSLVSSALNRPESADGGERIRDIPPAEGTLVFFDSVSLPHQVLTTTRERFGVQGWFHEALL